MNPPENYPLCVDLDGTLVRTDTLLELLLANFKKNPLVVFQWLVWLTHGLAFFKQAVSEYADISYALLPYHEQLVEFLKSEHARGRKLYIATASSQDVAHKVAQHLGIFADAMGTRGSVNLKGARKAAALVERFGAKQFSYVGNDMNDLKIWAQAADGMIVTDRPNLVAQAKALTTITHVWPNTIRISSELWRALRPYQWAKNALVAIPLIASHNLGVPTMIGATLVAMIAFSAVASAVYLVNDLLDLESDRRHHRKKKRPLAAASLPIGYALVAIVVLLAVGLVLALQLPPLFLVIMLAYLLLTCSYSFRLKRVVLVDVFLLAGLYTLRIYAGAAAIAVPVSSWLTAFGLFFFLSLAVVKRFTELQRLQQEETHAAHGRGYVVTDRGVLAHMGIASGFVAAVILALYISSPEIGALYTTPLLLWLLLPLQLYWLCRIWLLAHRQELVDDPLIFALRDRVSFIVALVFVTVVLAAT